MGIGLLTQQKNLQLASLRVPPKELTKKQLKQQTIWLEIRLLRKLPGLKCSTITEKDEPSLQPMGIPKKRYIQTANYC